MLDYNEMIGRFDASVGKSFKEQCTPETRVHLHDLKLSQAAMATIGEAIQEVAKFFQVPTDFIKQTLATQSEVFDVKGDLIFIFNFPSIWEYPESEQILQIPFGYWEYVNEKNVRSQ